MRSAILKADSTALGILDPAEQRVRGMVAAGTKTGPDSASGHPADLEASAEFRCPALSD